MKHTDTAQAIRTILRHVYIENEELFYVKGKAFPVTHRTPYFRWNRPMNSFGENTGDDSRRREMLLGELSGCLYSTFYTSGDPEGRWLEENPRIPAEEKDEFMNTLSAANLTEEGWDPLWTVVSADASGNVQVQKNGAVRMLMPNEWKPAQAFQGQLPVGASVSLRIKKEKRDLQPVFYYVYGREFLPYAVPLGRFYFNLKAEGATALISGITGSFNRVHVPFMFKCLNHPKLYVRADNAVLYIEKSRFRISARLLSDVVRANKKIFNKAVPMFSHPLSPGVSYAEDPGSGKSFGMYWCDLLAEGMVKAFEKGAADPEKREALIFAQLEKNGARTDASFRNTNSFFPYDFSFFKK